MPSYKQLFASIAYLFVALLILAVPSVMAQTTTLSPKAILALWLNPDIDFNGDGKGNSLDLGDLISPPAPDLIVTSSRLTGKVEPGRKPSGVELQVKNIGGVAANQNSVHALIKIIREDKELCNAEMFDLNIAIPPGETATIQSNPDIISFGACPKLETGDYSLESTIDSTNQISELNENNNAQTTPFTVGALPLPDLVVGTRTLIVEPRVGAFPQAVEFSIKNQGQAEARSGQVEVKVQLQDELLTVCTMIDTFNIVIKPGAEQSFRLDKGIDKCPGLNPYENYFFISIDTTNQVTESNESNNNGRSENIIPLVTPTPVPTTVPSLDLSVTDIKTIPAVIDAGKSITSLDVTVNNTGPDTLSNMDIPFGLNITGPGKSCTGSQTVAAINIPVGESQITINNIGCGKNLRAGQYTLRVTIDAGNKIVETDETNNSTTETFSITPDTAGVDLRILNIDHIPEAIAPGGRLTELNFFVYNSGQNAYQGPINFEAIIYQGSRTSPHCSFAKLEPEVLVPADASAEIYMGIGNNNCDALPAGTYTILVTVDPDNQIPELDDNNNEDTKSFTTVTNNYDFQMLNSGFSPTNFEPGNRITEARALFKNNGVNIFDTSPIEFEFKVMKAVDDFNLELHCRFLKYMVVYIEPEQQLLAEFPNITASECGELEQGSYQFVVNVDSDNRVQETNEGNNELKKDFSIPQTCSGDFCD